MLILYLFLLYFVFGAAAEEENEESSFKFPCPLKWISTADLFPIPSEEDLTDSLLQERQKLVSIDQLIPAINFEETYYWGKVGIYSNPTLVTVVYSSELQSFAQLMSNGTKSVIQDPLHLLANPNNCSLQLVSLKESSSIKTSFLTKLAYDSTYMSVQINQDRFPRTYNLCATRFLPSLQIKSAGSKQVQFQETYLLESFVEKVELSVKVTEFLEAEEKVEKFEIRFQSQDKLVNKGGAIKEETIDHDLLVEKSWKSTVGLSAKAGLHLMVEIELLINFGVYTQPLFSIVFHLEFELMLDLFLRHHIREVVSMSVGQTLKIPPHTSVDVCSTVLVKHYNLTILSQVEISHPFLSKDDILSVVQSDPERFTDVIQDDDNGGKIKATSIQSWRASEPWTASNYVLPFGSLVARGTLPSCDELKNEIQSGGFFGTEQEVSIFLSRWRDIKMFPS